MTGQPSSEQPSADTIKDRMDAMGQEQNLGSGNEEPDPATEGEPPAERQEGERARRPD